MSKLIDLARESIVNLKPYRCARDEYVRDDIDIYLDANESPWADIDMDADGQYNRYPDSPPLQLINALADLYGVASEQLLAVRGSDEAIDVLIRVFCAPEQDGILICPPTYGMYPVSAQIQGASLLEVPLQCDKDFAIDNKAIEEAVNVHIKLIFLCSPNNPTGNALSQSDILQLARHLENQALVVVDEAYNEFSTHRSLVHEIGAQPNLVVLRTLSKAYGLAGLRCGALIADPTIVALLRKVIPPYQFPTPVIKTVLRCLNPGFLVKVNEHIQIIRSEREHMADFLKKCAWVETVWPSEANFLLLKVKDAEQLLAFCAQRGVLIRNRSSEYGLANCVRMSIGLPEQNQRVMEILRHV